MATERTTQAGSSGEGLGNDYLTANKLAAISTALMSDTPVSMAASILPEGHALDTAAYRDAIRAVKKIIELRSRVAELESHIPPAQAEPVEAKGAWKPVHMEEVWVRAKATSVVDGMVELDFEGADDYIIVPLAQLRPLPVVQGGD